MFFLGVTLLSLCVIFGGGLAQEQCQSLVMASVLYPQCIPLGDCAGMTCTSTLSDGESAFITFVVNKCTDPLVVNVNVTSGGNSTIFSPTAIGFQQLTNESLTVKFNIIRNSSTVWVQASVGMSEIIPNISVPLNQTVCMCQTITSIANSLPPNSTTETGCMVNQQCSGVDCGVVAFATIYIETDIQPCENPPGILLIVRDSNFQPVYEGYFDSSNDVSISVSNSFSIPVSIIITQYSYSMNIEVDVNIQIGMKTIQVDIVGPAQVIVDTTKCSASTIPFVPAPPPEEVSAETCSIIADLTASSQDPASGAVVMCYKNDRCDGMKCHLGTEYTTDIQVLACSDPAQFYVKVTRVNTHVFSGVLTQPTSVDLQLYGNLQIWIIDYGNEISITVALFTGFYSFNALLSLPLRIPKDYCCCSNTNCSSTSCPVTNPSESPPTTQPLDSGPNVVAAVLVPIIVLILIVILVLAGIIALLIWRQRNAQFSFNQMKSRDPSSVETFQNLTEAAEDPSENINSI